MSSEPGHGATFRIYLPAVAGPPVDTAAQIASLSELYGHGERILLVEDEDGVRDFAAWALRTNGYEVLPVADLVHALGTFTIEKGTVDLLLSDVVLPDGTGPQLVSYLQARHSGLRVLLSSGHADRKSQWSLIQERGWPYLPKPYSLPDLLRAVRDALAAGAPADD
ncbi:MAG: response regulator [Chloroflexi bacterium]|nr:response regulator [Chloroflexota bacterium]MBU1751768.1 response regulator [Chloroflexota bacterium]